MEAHAKWYGAILQEYGDWFCFKELKMNGVVRLTVRYAEARVERSTTKVGVSRARR